MDSPKSLDMLSRLHANGDVELTRIFMLHRDNLRRLIASQIHDRLNRRLDASDIVQEAFIRASDRLKDYLAAPTIPPVVWLRILCKQLLAEHTRKQYRDKRNPGLEIANLGSDQIVDQIADSWHSAGEAMSKKELVERVRSLLTTLSITDREIIEMRHTEGYSFQEIADQLEIKQEAAKKRYYRALDRFRKMADGEVEP
ncbi:MAG: sigma-70 family RNA polymerase sigma factor [Rubripirellula sp.]